MEPIESADQMNLRNNTNTTNFEITPDDLNCHVFLFGHIPLVFFTMCVLSMLLKTRLLTATLTLSMMEYRRS